MLLALSPSWGLLLSLLLQSQNRLARAWTTTPSKAALLLARRPRSVNVLHSTTPFEADLYNTGDDGFDDDGNPYEQSASNRQQSSPLQVPPDTKLVLGLNKYSHDTTLCAADARTGQVLFALSKERLSRRKHDAGNVATLVEACSNALGLDLCDEHTIETVVINNHHHRILPLEANPKHMEWECGLAINGGAESGYDDEENLLPNAGRKLELSHHLAHAYSAAAQCPFDHGLIAVMDGMGETYRTMMHAHSTNDGSYVSDFSLVADNDPCTLTIIPSDLKDQSNSWYFDWREAESIYTFKKTTKEIKLEPLFKRFTQERSPPTLYNHGFENMDSAGALYSRASSDIFGDWNACGKVMGLAPWMCHSWTKTEDGSILAPQPVEHPIMQGTLYSEFSCEQFQANRTLMMGIPRIARSDPELFDAEGNLRKKRRYDFDDDGTVQNDKSTTEERGQETGKLLPTKIALDAIALASRIQIDLEDLVMDLVRRFKEDTGEINLCLSGGVALNSVLNGRLSRELGFEKTFIPPYPGDDGIAVGCCAFALYGPPRFTHKDNSSSSPPLWTKPLSPYLGPEYTEEEIQEAIEDAAPWLEFEAVRNDDRRLEIMAQEVDSGGVIAWYQGRSELGPRALGHRSILADPRKKGLGRFINQHVKKRESFRPFAPSVLAEEAHDWFDLGVKEGTHDDTDGGDHPNNVSPYMSITALVKEAKRGLIPAVTHVDGSSRLQTVTKEAEPQYHKFISKFFARTGVPLVLNTSFNTLPGEPIVETPRDAIRSFLSSMGSIEFLVMGPYIIKRKQADLRKLLGETSKNGEIIKVEPGCPIRAGPAYFQSSFEFLGDETDDPDSVQTVTKVRMPDRPMHDDRTEGWFELLDEVEGEILAVCDGNVVLNEILAQYTATPEDELISNTDVEESEGLIQNIIARYACLYDIVEL